MISSVVERFVHIEDVRGSNPLSPTIFPQFDAVNFASFALARRHVVSRAIHAAAW